MIPEPHRTYLLELFHGLGPVAGDFILAGAQALKFHLPSGRATRDFDFVLNVVRLREASTSIASVLETLGYSAVPGSEFFQFHKNIPGTLEIMRIEFMAPEDQGGIKNIRVRVQDRVQGRSLEGGSIAVTESDIREIQGFLPTGEPMSVAIRVVRPTAIVMLKLLALDDRYQNLRGPNHSDHDRNEARIHTSDVIAILSAQTDLRRFAQDFWSIFRVRPDLQDRVTEILTGYFAATTSPGLLLYEETLRSERGFGEPSSDGLIVELDRVVNAFQQLRNKR